MCTPRKKQKNDHVTEKQTGIYVGDWRQKDTFACILFAASFTYSCNNL